MAPTTEQQLAGLALGFATLAFFPMAAGSYYLFVYGPQVATERAEIGHISWKGQRINYQVSLRNNGERLYMYCLDGDKKCVSRDTFVQSWIDDLETKLIETEIPK